jgi:hypothetical protein
MLSSPDDSIVEKAAEGGKKTAQLSRPYGV